MNHMPWDNGALRLLGELVQQRTILTHCNKRVLFANADEREPITCSECAASVAHFEEFNLKLKKELEVLRANLHSNSAV